MILRNTTVNSIYIYIYILIGKLLDLKTKDYDAEKVDLNEKIKTLEGKLENIDNFIARKVMGGIIIIIFLYIYI